MKFEAIRTLAPQAWGRDVSEVRCRRNGCQRLQVRLDLKALDTWLKSAVNLPNHWPGQLLVELTVGSSTAAINRFQSPPSSIG